MPLVLVVSMAVVVNAVLGSYVEVVNASSVLAAISCYLAAVVNAISIGR